MNLVLKFYKIKSCYFNFLLLYLIFFCKKKSKLFTQLYFHAILLMMNFECKNMYAFLIKLGHPKMTSCFCTRR